MQQAHLDGILTWRHDWAVNKSKFKLHCENIARMSSVNKENT